jgi:hypothetical protein
MHDRLQFSIRSTLLLTSLFAALLAVFLCNPSAASILARFIVGFLFMSLAIIAIDITAGVARAFWIGVAAPLAMSSIWLSLVGNQVPDMHRAWAALMESFWQSFANALSAIPVSCCVALINGLLCALVYRLLRPQRGPASIPRLTFSLYGYYWLTIAIVAIAFFLGGMMFDRWRAAAEPSDDEPANTSVFRLVPFVVNGQAAQAPVERPVRRHHQS